MEKTNVKIMREREAMQRYAMSRSKVREVAEECGATVHIGRSFRIDQSVMDAYIDTLREKEHGGDAD